MRWGMICDSRHCQLCWKPGIPLKMDEQMENVLTTVSVLALRDVHTDPRVLDSLCEKQAVSYLPVTKSGVLTGLVIFKTSALPKINTVILHRWNSVLLFPGKLGQPLAVGNRKKKHLRLEACICIEKQGVLGRELFQVQELSWFCTLSFGCSVPRARVSVANRHWSISSPAAEDRSLSMQRLWLFWQLYTKFIWK